MTDPNPPPVDQLLLFAAAASPAVEQGRPAIQEQRPPGQSRGCPEKGNGGEKACLELPWDFRESFPEPMIAAFVHGTLHPDDADLENIKAIHLEHAAEADAILDELDALEAAQQHGVDPVTGKPPRTEEKRNELAELFANEPEQIRRRFDEHLIAYADAFGLAAADAFAISIQLRHRGIEVVQRTKPTPPAVSLTVLNNPRRHAEDQWDESRPRHYLHDGDRAAPVPVDQIEPSDKVHYFDIKLPKDEHRKRQRLESMHRDAIEQLEQDRQRYEDLRLNGADAISECDRTIAYGGNLQLAWASSIATTFCHVRYGLARVADLKRKLGADAVLFDTSDTGNKFG